MSVVLTEPTEEQANRSASKGRNHFCANAKITVKGRALSAKWDIHHNGCKNQRRNGSKFCQQCSDKHHGK